MPSSAKERAKSWKCHVAPKPFNIELPHPDSQNAALKKSQTKTRPIGVTKFPLHFLALSRCQSDLPARPISTAREAAAVCSPDLPARFPAQATSKEEDDRQESSFTHQEHV